MNKSNSFESSQSLAASITWKASKQSYYTVRFLVDRDRIVEAYQPMPISVGLTIALTKPQSARPNGSLLLTAEDFDGTMLPRGLAVSPHC